MDSYSFYNMAIIEIWKIIDLKNEKFEILTNFLKIIDFEKMKVF
jgi:hypothetical protein